jgi:hypothetical protein
VTDGVEHQRDPRKRLDGSVVEEECQPAPFVLLGGDQLLEQANALTLFDAALASAPVDGRPRLVSQ